MGPQSTQTAVCLLPAPACWALPGLQLIVLRLGKCPEAESWIVVGMAMSVSLFMSVHPMSVMETAVSCVLYNYCLSFGERAC